MNKRKIINISLWSIVIISILLFVVIIIVEHSFSRNAASGLEIESQVAYKSFMNKIKM
ncbi:hypothetical protein ACFSKI_14985 [Pseudogracilibacillus auburnensis]|uniref:Uncharacterized protein n=1 Tax=Pseudogracilibacillus auburnensis TaxID=1494959 RepID=A0A2V3VPH0_9BACI|nr:hypothetical protein [Pseudogracilibacillus auburnensis]MBO1001361.1 hypothetical protein [Pseudogracilibacillus auburnensis]PXW83763.1 hypothetical protein DFR56_11447 [Pseudogracilibacillus auburnensis]